jgi:hypothetical protein
MDYTSDSEILAATVPVDEGPGVSRLTIVMADGDTLTSEPIPHDEIKKVGIKWCDMVREQHGARETAARAEGIAKRRAESAASAEEATDTTQQPTAPGEATPTEPSASSTSDTPSLAAFLALRLPELRGMVDEYERRLVGTTKYLGQLRRELKQLEGLSDETNADEDPIRDDAVDVCGPG